MLTPETPYFPTCYDLVVRTADGTAVWAEENLALAHSGWGSVFACDVDGRDCLLRYTPAMYQGAAGYSYTLFSLEGGEETVLREGSVFFDVNFGGPAHVSFDTSAIAAFLEEVHGYLDESTLLLSTEDGFYASGGSGADFRGDDFSGTLYDTPGTWLERVRAAEEVLTS